MRMITVPLDMLCNALQADPTLGANPEITARGLGAMGDLRALVTNWVPGREPAAWLAKRLKGSLADRVFLANPEQPYNPDLYFGPYPVWDHPTNLQVFEGSMRESNGKHNYTAILHQGDITEGITLYVSEYPDRTRYEADMMRWMIGLISERPCIADYDTDKHSGWQRTGQTMIGEFSEEHLMNVFFKQMLAKMERSKQKGRSGWEHCTQQQLSQMLHEHIEKGDPVDVANFCFMLSALGHGIGPSPAKLDDMAEGIAQAMEMNDNMQRYGTIDAPKMQPINYTELSAGGNLWVISGRRPYDDEDTTTAYLADSEEQVRAAFEDAVYEGCNDPDLRNVNHNEHGAAVFVNFCQVLTERQ